MLFMMCNVGWLGVVIVWDKYVVLGGSLWESELVSIFRVKEGCILLF